MIKGAIFDIDDTIFNYDEANEQGLNGLYNYIGTVANIGPETIRIACDKIIANIKQSNNFSNKFNKSIYFKQFLEHFKIPLMYLPNCLQVYEDEFSSKLHLFSNIKQLFELLKKLEITICGLSNNKLHQQLNKLEKLNILHSFDFLITSDEIGEEKPSLHPFLYACHKMQLNPENIAMFGDNYEHDIVPAIKLKMIPFFISRHANGLNYVATHFEFDEYEQIINLFNTNDKIVNELVFLSKYFGQSNINVQGAGGNISIKNTDNDLIFVKSSGVVLGNLEKDNGYCLLKNINDKKYNLIYGAGIPFPMLRGSCRPSMETSFHLFTKKYTVHLHFLLANIFLCSDRQLDLSHFDEDVGTHILVEYASPGEELASLIHKDYKGEQVILLKNHGLIITADDIDSLLKIYENLYIYFCNKLPDILYCDDSYYDQFELFKLQHELYLKFNRPYVLRKLDIEITLIKNLVYCFPDLAIFCGLIIEYENLQLQSCDGANDPDIIIYNSKIYIVGTNMNKLHEKIDILNFYLELVENNKNNQLVGINGHNVLQNSEQEKYRKNLK